MIVLFENGRASLLLSGVKYDEEGNLKSGFVENGGWYLEIKGGEFLAKSDYHIVTRRPSPEYDIMEVPKEIKGDYNSVMSEMQRLYESTSRSSTLT